MADPDVPYQHMEAPGGLAVGSSPVGSRDEAPVGIWQGRRHGFESGGTNSASETSRKFYDPPLFGQWGTKYCLDIAKSA